MGDPPQSTSPGAAAQQQTAGQQAPSMLDQYLQSAGQLQQLGQQQHQIGQQGLPRQQAPSGGYLQQQRPPGAGAPYAGPASASVPIGSSRSSLGQQQPVYSGQAGSVSSQPGRGPATAAFSPSRSSFGSGYSLQSAVGGGDDGGASGGGPPAGYTGVGPLAAAAVAIGGAPGSCSEEAGPSGSGLPPRGSAGSFPTGMTEEELAAIDPRRAKRLIANRQSAQRSKARKLRHIMQLEEEVATLQGINAQQQNEIGTLHHEVTLVSAANRQLSIELGDVQEQLRNYHVFAELLVQELRRLSMMVGEPLQLPAFPAAMPQPFMAQPEAAYPVPSDIAQQQQQLLAAQYGLQAGLMGAFPQYPPAAVPPSVPPPPQQYLQYGGAGQQQQQQFPGFQFPRQPPEEAQSGFYAQAPRQRVLPRQPRQQQQRAAQQHRPPQQQQQPVAPLQVPLQPSGSLRLPAASSLDHPAATPTGSGSLAGAASVELPTAQSLERPPSVPPPAEGTLPAGIEGPPHAEATAPGGPARDAGVHALALAEDERDRRSVRFAQDEPGGSAEEVAEDPRRAAVTLAQTERGSTFPQARRDQVTLRPVLRTLSVPVGGIATRAESPAGASPGGGAQPSPEGGEQAPRVQQDPFRVNVPASAFELEERQARAEEKATSRWAGGSGQAGSGQIPPTVPEDSPIAPEQPNWAPSVGWALGSRVQQPYPEGAASVMQAFRGLSMQVGWQGSDPNPGYGGVPPQQQAQQAAQRGPYSPAQQAQRAQQEQRMASALQSGQYGNLSLDEIMMRSMSDPGFFQPREGGVLAPGYLQQQQQQSPQPGMSRTPLMGSLYEAAEEEGQQPTQQQQQQQQRQQKG